MDNEVQLYDRATKAVRQLLAATNDRALSGAILKAVGEMPVDRWEQELSFEAYVAATGLERKAVALDILNASACTDTDLDDYNTRINRRIEL